MAGPDPHSIMPDDLDRELANALRIEPSGEFRARIRARIDAEDMKVGWRLPLPAVASAVLAGVVVAGAIWFTHGAQQGQQVIAEGPAARVQIAATEATSTAERPTLPAPESRRPSPRVANVPGATRTTAPRVATEAAAAASAHASPAAAAAPEVLLSDSERAGVQLLFESAASGRLRLPEEMLRDLSLPIVEARTTFPDPDSPWVTGEGAVQ